MSHPPHPMESTFGSPSRPFDGVPWWWRLVDADGRVVEPEQRQEFPTRSDAESWLGEFYPELVDDGVSAVTLLEGDREVYGPMSLEAG